MEIKDSGTRREFESGAVRDIAEGKGRCDLLPLDVLGYIMTDEILYLIDAFVRDGNVGNLHLVITKFAEKEFVDVCTLFLEVAKHYEDGANKYEDRNWEKGIPLHCFIDSAVRHYLKYKRGDTDEPHNRAFVWNILGAMWTYNHHVRLIDLPFMKEVNHVV